MTKDEAHRAFPIGCTVRLPDGTPRTSTALVTELRWYRIGAVGSAWKAQVSDHDGRYIGQYYISDLERTK